MQLLLHIHSDTSDVDILWLKRNQYVLIDNWLDCTEWINYFNPEDIYTFISLIHEFTSIDIKYDRWKLV